MSYKIQDVANAFLSKSTMTHKKLQKLCYYAQCYYAYYNNKEKLADTRFEAWVHGPVSPDLYQIYRDFGFNEIEKYDGECVLDENAMDLVSSVFDAYGDFTANQLEALTHSEKPWQNARKGLSSCDPSYNEISIEDMYSFCEEALASVQPNV